jgi:hypothetical protein
MGLVKAVEVFAGACNDGLDADFLHGAVRDLVEYIVYVILPSASNEHDMSLAQVRHYLRFCALAGNALRRIGRGMRGGHARLQG